MRSLLKLCAIALAFPTASLAGSSLSSYETCTLLSASPRVVPVGEGFDLINLAVGDVVSWTPSSSGVNILLSNVAVTFTASTSGATKSLTITGPGSVSIAVSGLSAKDSISTSSATFTCTPAALRKPATPANDVDGDATGQISGANQTNATANGTSDNADNRFNNGNGIQVGKNDLYVSTQVVGVQNPEWNAWASVEYREFSSALTGDSLDFVGGVDKLIDDDTLVGVLLGYGKMDLSDGTNTSEQTSIAVGPYFAQRLDGMILDGFLTYARPDYVTTSGNFTSTRLSLGLSASGDALESAPFIEPYLDLRAFKEEQPAYGAFSANTINSYTVSLGAKFTAMQSLGTTGLTPHMSLGVDSNSTTSTLSGTDSFTYGRIGLGLSGQLGAGFLSIDVDYGKTRSDVFDRGIEMRWEMTF